MHHPLDTTDLQVGVVVVGADAEEHHPEHTNKHSVRQGWIKVLLTGGFYNAAY
jgi:hypothetical protein